MFLSALIVLPLVAFVFFLNLPMRQIFPQIEPLQDEEFLRKFFMRHCTVGDALSGVRDTEYAQAHLDTVAHFNRGNTGICPSQG